MLRYEKPVSDEEFHRIFGFFASPWAIFLASTPGFIAGYLAYPNNYSFEKISFCTFSGFVYGILIISAFYILLLISPYIRLSNLCVYFLFILCFISSSLITWIIWVNLKRIYSETFAFAVFTNSMPVMFMTCMSIYVIGGLVVGRILKKRVSGLNDNNEQIEGK